MLQENPLGKLPKANTNDVSTVVADDSLIAKAEAQAQEEVSKVIEEAKSLFGKEMARIGARSTNWDDLPNQIKAGYLEMARASWLNTYIAELQARGNKAEVDSFSQDVNIKTNTPDTFIFGTQDKTYCIIHRDLEGRVDVTLPEDTTYTESARAFLQILFEQANRISNVNFAQAFNLMRQGHWLTRGSVINESALVKPDQQRACWFVTINPDDGQFYLTVVNKKHHDTIVNHPLPCDFDFFDTASILATDWEVYSKLKPLGKSKLYLD